MMELNKEYVKTTLEEERLWKVGEADSFSFNGWELTLRKEEKIYKPFTYSVVGTKDFNTHKAFINRRYLSMEDAFLHVVNNFNENANIKNNYGSINEFIYRK
ncbi:hypothetical protein P5F71_08565 [Clostridium perfringens]|nr:hypothetical protein [Clostridium perfringens]